MFNKGISKNNHRIIKNLFLFPILILHIILYKYISNQHESSLTGVHVTSIQNHQGK